MKMMWASGSRQVRIMLLRSLLLLLCLLRITSKIRVPSCRALHGIHVFNYALNECLRGLDGFDVPKIKNYPMMGNFPSFNDMKSI